VTQSPPAAFIPVNEPLLKEQETKYVLDCLATGWISSEGTYLRGFEDAWAKFCGVGHGVAVTSGTTALFAAVAALHLQPGDEVILPSFTIVGCVTAILAAGAKPVLVDCEADTWCMDVAQVLARVTDRTRAVMPVHIYGHPVDMGLLLELKERRGIAIIEDAAEAHGAEWKGRRAGGIGDLGCFSFYANKIITTGEGGMVVTDDVTLAERMRSYRNLAFRPEKRFYHTEIGHNYRMTNMQAAVGLAQVEDADSRIARKREVGQAYVRLLSGTPGIQLATEKPWAKNVYWMNGVVLDDSVGYDAVEFARRLKLEGVDTRPFFLGMHEQPVFHDMGLFNNERYPVTERIARQGLYLPSGLTLTDEQLARVVEVVKRVLGAEQLARVVQIGQRPRAA
jgi:perosamine synthetase